MDTWWDHPDQAIDYAYARVQLLPRDTLVEILAEWRLHDRAVPDSLWVREWLPALNQVRGRHYAISTMVAIVWKRAFQLQTCDNGRSLAWLCPYGCDLHKVPLSKEDEDQVAFMTAAKLRLDTIRLEHSET